MEEKIVFTPEEITEDALRDVAGGVRRYEYYTVKRGDNLTKIARKYGTTWKKIYAANMSVIGDDPNLIQPGMVLRIPV